MGREINDNDSAFVTVEKEEKNTQAVKTDSAKEKEDKKKKWKSFLMKLLVVLILLGISIATSSVNLWDELREFMLRFVDIATS